MLEYPESHVLARQISENLVGKTVADVQVAASPHKFAFYFGEKLTYPDMLTGKTIDGATAFAGAAEISLGDVRIGLFDGVNARYHEDADKAGSKHQLLLRFTDGSAFVCSVQMYGGIFVFYEGELKNKYYGKWKQSVPILSDEFSYDFFADIVERSLAQKSKLTAKMLLATEQRVPGLGNGVLQDILFNAGVHHKKRVSELDEDDLRNLHRCVKETVAMMTEQGGRDIEKDLFGKPGGYSTILSSKTLMSPCPVCGSAIMRQAYLGGNIYFCPVCQPQ